jgi:hypothetical protein
LVVNGAGIILDEKWNAKESIIDALLEGEGNSKLDASNINKHKEFVEHILCKIKNVSKRMSWEQQNQGYLPKRMAMALSLQDNKACEELQEADYYLLPTILYMAKKKAPMTRSAVTAGAVLRSSGIPAPLESNNFRSSLGVMTFCRCGATSTLSHALNRAWMLGSMLWLPATCRGLVQ